MQNLPSEPGGQEKLVREGCETRPVGMRAFRKCRCRYHNKERDLGGRKGCLGEQWTRLDSSNSTKQGGWPRLAKVGQRTTRLKRYKTGTLANLANFFSIDVVDSQISGWTVLSQFGGNCLDLKAQCIAPFFKESILHVATLFDQTRISSAFHKAFVRTS